jgi:hypothetical protein
LLGFQAEIPLQTGLRELVNWWRAERASIVVPREREALAS